MPYCSTCGAEVAAGAASCAACGKLTAPPRPAPLAPASGLSGTSLAVAVVAGAMGLVFVLGVVAAIFIPNFIDALQKAKQKRTVADIRSAGTALLVYAADELTVPRVATMEELASHLEPLYLRDVPRLDGWGNELRYSCWGGEADGGCDDFGIASAGRDGVFEHESLADYPEAPFAAGEYDRDIVFRSGYLVQFPEAR